MSMVGLSESDDIFVSELKAKELMIKGLSVFFPYSIRKIKMLIILPWVL